MTDAAPLLGEYLEGATYTFLKTVGTGASGKSRLWLNEVLGIKVVSKTIDTFGLIGGIAKSEPRFLASLKHDHLVRIWEAQFDEGYDASLKVVTFTTTYHEGRRREFLSKCHTARKARLNEDSEWSTYRPTHRCSGRRRARFMGSSRSAPSHR